VTSRPSLADLADLIWRDYFKDTATDPYSWRETALALKEAGDVLHSQFESSYAAWQKALASADESRRASTRITGNYGLSFGLTPPRDALQATVLLLWGFALENLVKALLTKQDPDRVKDGRLKPWPGAAHNLAELLAATGIDLVQTAEEEVFVARLAASIRWGGRYPTPNHFKEMMPAAGEKPKVIIDNTTLWPVLFETLFARIEQQIAALDTDPRPGE
jgi:hypothetical protein